MPANAAATAAVTGLAEASWVVTTLQAALVAAAVAAVYAAVVLAAAVRDRPRRTQADARQEAVPAAGTIGDAEAPAVEREPPAEEPEPTHVPPRPPPRPAPAPAPAARPHALPSPSPPPSAAPSPPEACEIRWWRGYVSSTFYAAAAVGAEAELVIAESPSFRWRRPEPPPRGPSATAALETLVAGLEEDGWSVVGHGDEWFSLRLRRTNGRAA